VRQFTIVQSTVVDH